MSETVVLWLCLLIDFATTIAVYAVAFHYRRMFYDLLHAYAQAYRILIEHDLLPEEWGR